MIRSNIKLDENMPIEYMQKLMTQHGLPSYGGKVEIISRWVLATTTEAIPTIRNFHTVCDFYNLSKPKKHGQIIAQFQQNNIHWQYDASTKMITHWKVPTNKLDETGDQPSQEDVQTICDDMDETLDSDNVVPTGFDVAPLTEEVNHNAFDTTAMDGESCDFDLEELVDGTTIPVNHTAFDTTAMDGESCDFGLEEAVAEVTMPIVTEPGVLPLDVFLRMCDVCKLEFDSRRTMVFHRRRHFDQTQHVCSICLEVYSNLNDFLLHCESHRVSNRVVRSHVGQEFRDEQIPCDRRRYYCGECGKGYQHQYQLKDHLSRGHANPRNGDTKIILRYDGDVISPVPFEDGESIERIVQLVAVPWIDANGDTVQVSIGFTSYCNVTAYATLIWARVQHALKKKGLRLTCCTSAAVTAAYYDVIMNPAAATSLDVYGENISVLNFAKGYARQRFQSLGHNCKVDVLGILNPSIEFIENQLALSLQRFAPVNKEFFLEGFSTEDNFMRRRKFNMNLFFDNSDMDNVLIL